jgi:hypothetical protein
MEKSRISPIRDIDPKIHRYDSLIHLIEDVLNGISDQAAIICGLFQQNYAQLNQSINALSKISTLMDLTGKRVTVMIPKSVDIYFLYILLLPTTNQVIKFQCKNPFVAC